MQGAPVRLSIYGINFNSPISVFIGGERCLGEASNNEATFATCNLPAGTGLDKLVSMTVIGQASQPLPLVSYAAPTVDQILGSGCTSQNAQTVVECPRTGNQAITVRGRNFGRTGARILLGASLCSNVTTTVAHTELTCTSKAGTGLNLGVVVLQNAGELGASNATYSYLQCQPGFKEVGLDCIPCE